jgi:acyl-CoA synthetase (AMP-forming)/AMP-acid ligase II
LVSLSGSAQTHFPDIRLLDCGGGKLIRQDLQGWRRLFPPTCLLNYYYGSTEAGLVTIQKYTPDSPISDPVPPLGFPAPDCEIVLVDAAGQARALTF